MAVVHAVPVPPRRGVVVAGRIIAVLGALHVVGTGLMNLEHVPDWLGRRGVAPPAFVAWGIGGWGTAGALIFEPSPFLLVWIPAVMLWRDASTVGVVGAEDHEQHA